MLLFSLQGIITAFILVAVFILLLLIGEYFRKTEALKGESARKFVHAFTGTWAALWPAFLDLKSIAVLTVSAALIAVFLRRYNIFRSVYSVRRLSMGEVLIGIGLSVAALLADNGAVFSSAVLIIAWSDSAAALVGQKYGKKNSFKILSSKKSLIGSAAFFVSSVIVLMSYMYYTVGPTMLSAPDQFIGALLLSSIVATGLTIVELVGVYGMDNLTIPLFATLVLNSI